MHRVQPGQRAPEAERQQRGGISMTGTTPTDTIICGDCLEEMKKLPDISRNSRREQAKIFCVEEILPDALDEIERLRAENLELQVAVFGPDGIRAHQACIIADQAARISELEIEIAELKADLEQSERVIEARLDVIDQQAAHIQELEDALVENLAADIAYDDRLLWSRLDGQRQDEYREKARQQLQAEGKIGTGARPPCWQITEDRVIAIDQGLRFLEWSNAKTGHVETKKRIAILKTMLEEASDEHGFER